MSTAEPKVVPHRRVISFDDIPDPVELPEVIPKPQYQELQYKIVPHEAGRRRGEKRRHPGSDPSSSTTPTEASGEPRTEDGDKSSM